MLPFFLICAPLFKKRIALDNARMFIVIVAAIVWK